MSGTPSKLRAGVSIAKESLFGKRNFLERVIKYVAYEHQKLLIEIERPR